MDRKSEFERSNAFVDAELDRDARGEVLAAAARDPRLAKELSDLTRLKSALEDSVEVPEIGIGGGSRRRARRPMALALAACLALAALTGIGWWWLAPGLAPGAPSPGIPVAWAMDVHRSWRDSGAETAARPLLRPATARLDAYVPDLSAAKLRVAHIGEVQAPGGGRTLVVGYLGTRGCRVTLLMESTPSDLGETATYFETGGLLAMTWQAGPLRHLILAQGMDRGRFKMIAETVRRASLDRLPVDQPTRMALAQSRAESPPCAA